MQCSKKARKLAFGAVEGERLKFLMNLLANGPVAMKTIEEKAAEYRYSKDQLHRAKRKMNVVAFKEEGTLEGHWFRALAQHAPNKKDTDEA